MIPIIFANTRYSYDSYTDYRRLIELSGFETCAVDQIDLGREAFYIVSPINGEFRPHIEYRQSLGGKKKCKIAWWNLERPDSGPIGPNDIIGHMVANHTNEMFKWLDYVWVSDRYYQSMDPRMIHVVMGSHPDLAEAQPAKREWDLIHLSYLTYRREFLTVRMAESGLKIAPNSWGAERANYLSKTKAMLNIHQTPEPIGEPLRIALAAAYHLPLLTEEMRDPWPLQDHYHMLACPYDQILEKVKYWMSDADLETIGEGLFNLLCYRFCFKDSVIEGVKESLKRQP